MYICTRIKMDSKVLVFEDCEALKVGLEETRKQILEMLSEKNMSISQIAEELGKDQSTVYRHMKKLEETGFIEVKGERREHHIPERVYGRTAEMFLMAPEPMDKSSLSGSFTEWDEKRTKKCIDCLEKAGFECNGRKDEIAEELTDTLTEVDKEVTEMILTSVELDENKNFFLMFQLKLLATVLKLECEDELKKKIEFVASRFEV